MNWIMGRLFGPLIDFLVAWSPYLWLLLIAAAGLALFVMAPLVFRKWWRALPSLAVAGFCVLWVWQHYAGIHKLETKVEELQVQNTQLTTELTTAKASVKNYEATVAKHSKAVSEIETNQRQIRRDITVARRGLDSTTITQETKNDPVQASVDLSDRWNRLGGLFDDSTAGAAAGGAGPTAAAAPARAD